MIRRFHGMDRHKKYSTVSVLDRDGKEVRFHRSCAIEDYLSNLGAEDAVVLEASCGCFYWADRIEASGATCFVLDPLRFRIVTDSWNKTDRQDARNMAKALWEFLVTGEFGIPTVYKPSETIRTLRRLFATYNLLNRQIRMLENAIQAMLTDDGAVLSGAQLSRLFAGREPVADALSGYSLSPTIGSAIEVQAALLQQVNESKNGLARQIVVHSEPLAEEIELLVTIPGVTPLTAAAFLADIGDIRRFKSLRQMNAYLGLVPRCHDSGGKSRSGHITGESRKLTRTILTQSIYQAVKSTPSWQRDYDELKARRGAGRARIAMIRRLSGVKEDLYQRKLRAYRQALENAKNEQKAA